MKKRIAALAVVFAMIFAFSVPATAHPRVPEQSILNISENAAGGIHKAAYNVMDSNGAASHVFYFRFNPHR